MDGSLENFMSENPEVVRSIVTLLDKSDAWKDVVFQLHNYRIPVFLKTEVLEGSSSPTNYLLNELLKRACTFQDFKNLLRQCRLLDVLSLLEEPEPVEIIVQPGDNLEKRTVAYGDDLRLECIAVGLPPPKYQWYCDNTLLAGCNSSTLLIPQFKEEFEGEYYCVVSQETDEYIIQVHSNVIFYSLLESLPVIVQSPPLLITAALGSEIKLEVEVTCRSNYEVEWYKNNQLLDSEHDTILAIKSAQLTDIGVYRCMVKNSAGEVFAERSEIVVNPVKREKNKAFAKVALIIANSQYENFPNLQTPSADALKLAGVLESLNFHVITLINLTRDEMMCCFEWFFKNLPPKAYAFFCYIGHGFLLSNNKFMMPVDCPKPNKYRMADCIWDELLIKKAKEKKLRLIVTVLDMCLKGPNSIENPDIFTERHPNYCYEPYHKCSVVQAFATSNHQGAYEDPNMTNGLYIEHICKYLECDKPVVHIFQHAHEEFQKNKVVVELQTPTLSFDANTNFKFTDPIEEDKDAEKILLPFETAINGLKTYHSLYFPDAKLNTTLIAMPHKNKILNAIDLLFSPTLMSQWNPSVFYSHTELEYDWTSSSSSTDVYLTLFNIQKVKTDIYITPILHDEKNQSLIESSTEVDLGLPLIASAKFWLYQK